MTEGIGFEPNKKRQMKMDFIDVRRAYFHADAIRDVYIELPSEFAKDGLCGKLLKSMYGTRDAAQNWERAYIEFLLSIGFKAGESSPCSFYHPERNVEPRLFLSP